MHLKQAVDDEVESLSLEHGILVDDENRSLKEGSVFGVRGTQHGKGGAVETEKGVDCGGAGAQARRSTAGGGTSGHLHAVTQKLPKEPVMRQTWVLSALVLTFLHICATKDMADVTILW